MCRLLILPLLLISLNLSAQEAGYIPGYVITVEKDTIDGLVKNINQVPYRVLENIKFKRAEGEKVQVFSPEELHGYVSDEDLYLSKTLPGGRRLFVNVVASGYLSLYSEFSARLQSSPATGAYMTSSTQYYLQKANEKFLTTVVDMGFKNQMLKYLSDAPRVCAEIEAKTLKRRDLEAIVSLYNKETGH